MKELCPCPLSERAEIIGCTPSDVQVLELATDGLQRLSLCQRDRLAGAQLDRLSGLSSYDAFLEKMTGRFEQGRREQDTTESGIAAFFVDGDGIKAINDEHGHEKGDQAIQQLAERLTHAVRDDSDTFVTRRGGDEFVVVMFSLSKAQAEDAAERLENALIPDDMTQLGATVGMSHASAVTSLEQLSGLIDTADQVVNERKRMNRIRAPRV